MNNKSDNIHLLVTCSISCVTHHVVKQKITKLTDWSNCIIMIKQRTYIMHILTWKKAVADICTQGFCENI